MILDRPLVATPPGGAPVELPAGTVLAEVAAPLPTPLPPALPPGKFWNPYSGPRGAILDAT